MPGTHLSLHYHIVFSTKNREPFIAPEWRPRLHAYLGGIIRDLNGVPEAVDGTADHVHLLAGLRATGALAGIVQEIKQASSKWVHQEIGLKEFSWQPGYGAFTVSVSNLPEVTSYIEGQEEHHRVKTFQEEYLAFLKKSGVEYDERYLW